MSVERKYDVAIIGGGVVGASTLYVLARYTNLGDLCLLERGSLPGSGNSSPLSNSQTLHFGDIETNYSLESARVVDRAARLVVSYIKRNSRDCDLYRLTGKMVLAVGEQEVLELSKRRSMLAGLFPKLRHLGRDELAEIEPTIVAGREKSEKISALWSPDGYAVNFQALSESFVTDSMTSGKNVEVFLNTEAESLTASDGGYLIKTRGGSRFFARAILVASGAYSLTFAKQFGLGRDLAILPVAGGFYTAKDALLNKVYRVRISGVPFAAMHGDPDVSDPSRTRFGPSAMPAPYLDRWRQGSLNDFLKSDLISFRGAAAMARLFRENSAVRRYAMSQLGYILPVIHKSIALRAIRKIVPAIRKSDFYFDKSLGGVRPQVLNLKTGELLMGEAKLTGSNAIFDISPSTGASTCIDNAMKNAQSLVGMLGEPASFDHDLFHYELS